MDRETLIATYEARSPLYTEGDFMRRFIEIRNARAIGLSGAAPERPPEDWMIALLASGRVSDAEYFRLASLQGVDATGLIHAEPAVERSFADQLFTVGRSLTRLLTRLRRV